LILVLVLEQWQGQADGCGLVAAGAFEVDEDVECAVCEVYRQASGADLREDVHFAVLNDAGPRCLDGLDPYGVDDLDLYGVGALDPYCGDDLGRCGAAALDQCGAGALDRYRVDDLGRFAGDVLDQLFLSVLTYFVLDFYCVGSC
jgi:hypothetical protein